MPVPAQFVTQQDLEDAITGEKLRELLGDKGKAEASPRRVKLCIESGTSFVLGHIQRAVKNSSLDVLWDSPQWTDRDRAEVRRLVLSAAIYYCHYHGQKAEELPEAVVTERDYVEARAKEIGDHLATIGAEPQPATSPQHYMGYTTPIGHYPAGSLRSYWRGF
jgi:hypothetical protein